MTIASKTIAVSGLDADIDILIDRWGIPHIYAASQDDAFFAQGWNAARDRLWQIDLWRKRGLGLLASDFGSAYIEKDKAARLFIYRGGMDAEWACYGQDARKRTKRFVAGINAYVDLVLGDPDRLPLEFRLMDTKPAHWAAEDVVRVRSHARVHNLDHELRRAAVVREYGTEADQLRKRLEPAWNITVPDGFEPGTIPPEIHEIYLLATESPQFGQDSIGAKFSAAPSELLGSNAWALRPERTTTGRAIMASDPHRAHVMPSLRYVVHLHAPGLNVIGAGEPAVPGVSFGHNEDIAFGLTIFPTDQEDLYVYELDPDNPKRYRYGGDWETMQVVRETMAVRDQDEQAVELYFTRHGPVLHIDSANHRAYALRTVWTEPGTAAYLASLNYIQARNWEEYLVALRGWGAPSTNHIVADTSGNIGWSTAGKIPVRPNWDGLMPVPGDGRYEWSGFMAAEDKPSAYNPPHGWVATANQFNLPDDFNWRAHRPGFEWPDPSRYRTITDRFEKQAHHSLDDVKALQTSFESQPGKRVCALIANLSDTDGALRAALDLLGAWNHALAADSAGAALFEIWFARHLMPATLAAVSPEGLQDHAAIPDSALALDLLESADPRIGTDPEAARDRLLRDTLTAAWSETADLLGPDPAAWAWGKLHQGYFEHPLSPVVDATTRRRLDIGPLPKGGSGLTVNSNNYRASDFRVVHGVTWRMVCDVGNWSNCWTINCPGQSGDPDSQHYSDLFPLWSREEYVPLLYERAAIEAETERHITLKASP